MCRNSILNINIYIQIFVGCGCGYPRKFPSWEVLRTYTNIAHSEIKRKTIITIIKYNPGIRKVPIFQKVHTSPPDSDWVLSKNYAAKICLVMPLKYNGRMLVCIGRLLMYKI